MVKIAVELERALARAAAGAQARGASGRELARGEGWVVEDVICTSGPRDRRFEERHSWVSIAIVLAGTFQYRASCGNGRTDELMTPGALLLGNPGQHFECGHEHAAGDRCVSFRYAPEYFERLTADAGAGPLQRAFRVSRLPALCLLAPLTAQGCASVLAKPGAAAWEEMSIRLAALAMQSANGLSGDTRTAPPSALARVTRAARRIERDLQSELTVASLAREARLSPYHFLRTFEQLTGLTPRQFVKRARLRAAAARLQMERGKVLEIALDCGFGDVSNFNRAFRGEFGASPRAWRNRRKLPE